jgi:hypothetical protein
MDIETLQQLTGAPRLLAQQVLEGDRRNWEPTADQAHLEHAILLRLGLLARGHTPSTVEPAIRWIEARRSSVVVHTGDGFDLDALVGAVTPELGEGALTNGIAALRSGPSMRGVVLYRDGVDAALILAGTSYHDWRRAIDRLRTMSGNRQFVTNGGLTREETAAMAAGLWSTSSHGSSLLRTIGTLQALPHTRIDIYGKSPGTVVEIVQPEPGYAARDRMRRALERAGLEFVADRSPVGRQATYVFRLPGEEALLLIRLVVRGSKFPA